MSKLILTLSFSALFFVQSLGFFNDREYAIWFHVDATYSGVTAGGNCGMGSQSSLPSVYHKMIPVEINTEQYANSSSCGACIELVSKGKPLGPGPLKEKYFAYVHGRCDGCGPASMGLSIPGTGMEKIKWSFIACPKSLPQLKFEGSTQYYKKVQIRGMVYPAEKMIINGKIGRRSEDNYFISSSGPFPREGLVKVVDIVGNSFQGMTNLSIGSGIINAPKDFFPTNITKHKDRRPLGYRRLLWKKYNK